MKADPLITPAGTAVGHIATARDRLISLTPIAYWYVGKLLLASGVQDTVRDR